MINLENDKSAWYENYWETKLSYMSNFLNFIICKEMWLISLMSLTNNFPSTLYYYSIFLFGNALLAWISSLNKNSENCN